MVIQKPLDQCHIAIEGAIGVGKTTLTHKLAERFNANTLLEDVDDNPFIEFFYQDPSRHAMSVQLSFLFSRLKQWQSLQQPNLFTRGLISDYLFAKDRLFANINLSDEEIILYDQVVSLACIDIAKPDLVIYLQSDPDVVMQRIRQRNLRMEHGLSEDYLRKVIEAYEQFFFRYQDTPLLVVQSNHLNFSARDEDVDALLVRIQNMRSNTEFWAECIDP
ncbi:MAG: deoxynucleoside kinase [Mariprofundaceae bacterium]|nr:deoxynucleoside kinase [Mariprofundaceae bacterium]